MVANHWYGVKCLLEHAGLSEDTMAHVYEERIVLLRAVSFEEALLRAERDATEYARPINARYLGYSNAYKLDADSIDDATEVFSLMREVPLASGGLHLALLRRRNRQASRNVDHPWDPFPQVRCAPRRASRP